MANSCFPYYLIIRVKLLLALFGCSFIELMHVIIQCISTCADRGKFQYHIVASTICHGGLHHICKSEFPFEGIRLTRVCIVRTEYRIL